MDRAEGKQFISKCVAIAEANDLCYEDDLVKVEVMQHGMLTLEVTRKAIHDPDRPHLRVENPVIMCVQEGEERFHCIRAHGEHNVIKEHVESLYESL